jgi:phosphoglycerol transferase MdoB-like AlkP superfamily enzyme
MKSFANWFKPDFRLRLSCCLLLLSVAIFSFFRLLVYISYHKMFAALPFGATLFAFVNGVRFDLSTIALFAGLPLLMILLPIPWKLWHKLWALLFGFVCALMSFLLVSDLVYFSFIKRHLGRELLQVTEDKEFLSTVAFSYIPQTLAALALCAFICWLAWKIADRFYERPKFRFAYDPLVFVLCAGLLVLAIRGRIADKTISVVDAYVGGDTASGNLTLNGVFSAYWAYQSDKDYKPHLLPTDEACKTVQAALLQKNEYIPDPKFPLSRARRKFSINGKGYNVVVVLMESWSAKYVDSFTHGNYGVTPNFDALAAQGLRFTNFYSSGQRSIYGISAVLAGIPIFPGIPDIGRGHLELSSITRVGTDFRARGYCALMGITSTRGAYRMSSISDALGFQEFFGMQDIPVEKQYLDKSIYGWDYEGLRMLNARMEKLKQPFYAFFFTGTTHLPGKSVLKEFTKYPDNCDENNYLNRLYYSDWAVGEFMKRARKMPGFDKTVFMFMADHPFGSVNETTWKEKFHIPLLVYCPALIKPGETDRLGTQNDIVPSLYDLLNIPDAYSALGKSVFDPDGERFAPLIEGSNLYLLDEHGLIKHTLATRIEEQAFDKKFNADKSQHLLLSLVQSVNDLITENRWHP